MQISYKYLIVILIFIKASSQQRDNKNLFDDIRFNFEGIWNINDHSFQFQNLEQDNELLKITYSEDQIYLELNYQEQLAKIKLSGFLDIKQIDDLSIKQSGSTNLIYEKIINDELQEIHNCPIFFFLQFNQKKIIESDDIKFRLHITSQNKNQNYGIYVNLNVTQYQLQWNLVIDAVVLFLIYLIFCIIQTKFLITFRKGIFEKTINVKQYILAFPYYFNCIIAGITYIQIISQISNLLNEEISWYYYFIPIFIIYLINFCNLMLTFFVILMKKFEIFFSNNKICLMFLVFFLIGIYSSKQVLQRFIYIVILNYSYDTNLYYYILIQLTYLPQIIYNFKFKTIKQNQNIFFILGGMTFFQTFYTIGCEHFYDNNFSNLQKILILLLILFLFISQAVILYLQYQYGPRNLLPICLLSGKEQQLLDRIDADAICPICQANLKDENSLWNRKNIQVQVMVQTQCGHIFHEECLQTWYSVKKKCPCCNQNINSEIFTG